MSSAENSTQPFRILSLDGGGIRCLSSLLILERIMEDVKLSRGLDELPKPCEIFDLIGGTSTGGIIAIMLGRLEMTVDQSIRAYKKLAETAFTENAIMSLPGSFPSVSSTQNLEHAIKQTIRENCVSPECIERRNTGMSVVNTCGHEDMLFYDSLCTKTAVLAITKDNIDTLPTLFKTYNVSTGFSNCQTWEVARAASAETTFFKPIKLGRDEIEFIDAGFGHNNPCERLIAEAEEYCQNRPMLILSIGTGLRDVIEVGKTSKSIDKALKEMATTSKATALRLKERYGNTKQYYRFNVEDGLKDVTLSDWKQASRISSHTNNYLLEHKEEIRNFVSALTISSISQASTRPTELYSDPSASIQLAELEGHKPVHFIPFNENLYFVGREEVLSTLKGRLFAQSGFQQVALIGLGGMGKTQIALKLAYWVKETKPEYSIFWLTGASISNFDNACKKLVEELKIKTPDNEDSKILMKDYLESKKSGHWLLIIDNADETETFEGSIGNEICHFLPQSVTGRVLFTTRSILVAWSAVKDCSHFVELDGMSPEESGTILERSVKGPQESHDTHLISAIAQELCYLPLAIAQAADYICRNSISPGEYLKLLRSTETDKIQLLERRHFDKVHYYPSQGAVVTTWIITFKQIEKDSQPAATLLEFISQIDAKAIPQSIFPKFKTEQEMTNAIGVLQAYGFLRRQQADDLLDMHSLVHLTTKLWFESQGNQIKQRLCILEHIASVFPGNEWENRYRWRRHLPHALQVFEKEKVMSTFACNLALKMGRCLLVDGNMQECIRLFEQVVAASKETLEADHPSLLSSQRQLATAYFGDGQVRKAISILEHVVAAGKEALEVDHHGLLASQHELARAYFGDGQAKKAIPMLEHVVAAIKEALGADHPSLLTSQHQLATAYLGDGQVGKAIPILEHVVATSKETLEADHPSLLSSQCELARAYISNCQAKQAIPMLEHVVAASKETLRADHPSLLSSQRQLATAYVDNGQVKKAIPMLKHVVAARKEALTVDDPRLLASQHELGRAYTYNGQAGKAIPMLEHVVAARKEALRANHPSLLSSQRQLATAYVDNGQVGKAIPMLEHVVAASKEILRAGHPSLLLSQQELARAYTDNGQAKNAIPMLEHAVVASKEALAVNDPRLLAFQHQLATAYLGDGQVGKAIPMFEYVVAARKEALTADNPSLLSSQRQLATAYLGNGQVGKAITMLEHVVAARKEALTVGHPILLSSQRELARAYTCNGQVKKAIPMFEHVVAARKEALTVGHPSLLLSQHELARAYTDDGQAKKAIPMLEHVVVASKEALAVNDPRLLAFQHQLATAYLGDGQVGKAIPMFEYVVAARKEALTVGHPILLSSQRELARAYTCNGQAMKAIPMLENVVAAIKEALGADHPSLLSSQRQLATAYVDNGQVKKAIPMLEHIVAARKEALTVGHPGLLASQHELARAYLGDGQVGKAIPMLEHVVAASKETLTADHPSLLSSQRQLATAYVDNGQVKKAIPMLEHVVAARKEALAVDDPRLLASQHELARAYTYNGQAGKAIPMLEHVVAVRKEALRADDPSLLSSQRQLARAYLKDGQVEKATQLP